MFGAQMRSPVSFSADKTLAIAGQAKVPLKQEAPSRCPIPALDCTLFEAWEVVFKLPIFVSGAIVRFTWCRDSSLSKRLFVARKLPPLGRERIIHIAVMCRWAIRETMQVG
jgi:hypothetical protein